MSSDSPQRKPRTIRLTDDVQNAIDALFDEEGKFIPRSSLTEKLIREGLRVVNPSLFARFFNKKGG